MGVLDQVVLGHADVADGHGQAKDLLHLELDGGLDVVDLAVQVVTVGDEGRELAGPVQSRPEDPGNIIVITVNSIIIIIMINIRRCIIITSPRDLTDQRLAGEEGAVALCQLLDLEKD